MIIECKKKPKDYEPVKGNETKIGEHLLKHNYYDKFLIDKNESCVSAIRFILGLKTEKNRGTIYTGNFNATGHENLHLNREDFFRLNDDGSISKSDGEHLSKEYVAVELNFNNDFPWGNWILNAPNILVIRKDKVNFNPYRRNLQLGSFYPVNEGDILIFEKEDKTLIEILHRTSADMIDLLQENGYYITKKH